MQRPTDRRIGRALLVSFAVVSAVTLLVATPASASSPHIVAAGPGVVDAAITKFFQEVADWLRDGLLSLVNTTIDIIVNAPEPNITGKNGWFSAQYSTMFQLTVLLTVPFAIVGVIAAVIKGGLQQLLKTILVGVPVAILGTIAALAVIDLMLKIDQEFVDVMLDRLREDYAVFTNQIMSPNNPTSEQIGLLMIQIFIMLFMAIGTIVLYIELIFRSILIYLVVLFLPLSFAAYVWSPARAWFAKLSQILAALIVSKALLVGTLTMAFAAIRFAFGDGDISAGAEFGSRLGALFTGTVAFFFAALSGPSLIAAVLGPDGRPSFTRKEFGHYLPGAGDQISAREQYQAFVPAPIRRVTGWRAPQR